jgi:hypothetical protein
VGSPGTNAIKAAEERNDRQGNSQNRLRDFQGLVAAGSTPPIARDTVGVPSLLPSPYCILFLGAIEEAGLWGVQGNSRTRSGIRKFNDLKNFAVVALPSTRLHRRHKEILWESQESVAVQPTEFWKHPQPLQSVRQRNSSSPLEYWEPKCSNEEINWPFWSSNVNFNAH